MCRTTLVYTSRHADGIVNKLNITLKSVVRLCFSRRKASILMSTLVGFVASGYLRISNRSSILSFSSCVVMQRKTIWLFSTDFEGPCDTFGHLKWCKGFGSRLLWPLAVHPIPPSRRINTVWFEGKKTGSWSFWITMMKHINNQYYIV